jgi:hypothetical protein
VLLELCGDAGFLGRNVQGIGNINAAIKQGTAHQTTRNMRHEFDPRNIVQTAGQATRQNWCVGFGGDLGDQA